jgi:hypothetical protein
VAASAGLAAALRGASAADVRAVARTAGTAIRTHAERRRLLTAELILLPSPGDHCATVAARMATSAVNSANPPSGTKMPARRFAVNTEATLTSRATSGGP